VISLDEFTKFLLSRNSQDETEWLTVDHLVEADRRNPDLTNGINGNLGKDHRKKSVNRTLVDQSTNLAPSASIVSSSDGRHESSDIPSQANLLLRNLKFLFTKRVLEMRQDGKIEDLDRLSYHTSQLVEKTIRQIITRAFTSLQRKGNTSSLPVVKYPVFSRQNKEYLK